MLLIALLSNSIIYGQNKKEQINILDQRIDSLLSVISKQNNTIGQLTTTLFVLNEKLSNLNKDLFQLNETVKNEKNVLEKKELQIAQLNKTNDSISILLFNQFAHSQTNWSIINLGETINNFTFSKELKLFYKDKLLSDLVIRKNASSIGVSPCSYNGQWVIIDTYQSYIEEYDQPGFFICDLFKNKTYNINPNMPPLHWLSWSPNLTNVLIGSYYEANMNLYNINLKTFKQDEIKFPVDLVKDDQGIALEEVSFNGESIKWISDKSLEIIVNVNCNPFIDEENCDGDKRHVILRSYTFTFDVQTNKIINEKVNEILK